MKAVIVREHGGPEAMRVQEVDDPAARPGEAVVRVAAAGVNFIDTYHRTGSYPGTPPFGLGVEGAGEVVAVGEGTEGLEPGDRVAWTGVRGAYAELQAVPADKLVPVPDDVGLDVAAAALIQGMTAHYLTHATFRLEPGHTCLVHAAAGGTGLLLCQMAKRRGARVIGTASTIEKADAARAAGADEMIVYTERDFVEAVAALTNGAKVDVVYDSVGRSTFHGSLDCLRKRGMMVLFGASSGAVEPIDPQILNRKGSLFLTRPSVFDYIEDRSELRARAGDVFDWIRNGELEVKIDSRWPLEDAAEAHRRLESRESSGKLLLLATAGA